MNTVAVDAPNVTPSKLSWTGLLERADTLECWSATAPVPLATAIRRRAGALRLLAWVCSDADYPLA